MSFFNLQSSRASARTSSPLPDADDTADLLAQLCVLEREVDREEDGSFLLVDEASADGARPREELGFGARTVVRLIGLWVLPQDQALEVSTILILLYVMVPAA
jgi:hypothetical protein